jgi:hypothetical protein
VPVPFLCSTVSAPSARRRATSRSSNPPLSSYRTFEGVLAWGLLFLLEPVAQALVIEKVAGALHPGGRFLFTAPKEPLEWLDAMIGRQSQSLGAQTYERLLRDAGLTGVAEAQDEGANDYYFVERRLPSRGLEGRQQ